MTSIGKYRHLSQSSTPAGHFVILAIDHRANLLETLNKAAPSPLTDAEFIAFKQEVIRHLLPAASALLTDPAYGIGPGISQQIISGQRGLLAPIEVTDYSAHPSRRDTSFIPGWSVVKIKRVGGSGVKLLLNYHPEAANARKQRDVVAQLVEECNKHDIPFFLEPLTYSLDAEKPLNTSELQQIVVEMAKVFSEMGVDILKLQFPVDPKQEPDETRWRTACDAVNNVTSVPWTLLSAGVNYETFVRQTQVACEAGASGVIVGRAVWAETTHLQGAARTEFLATTARQRMNELASICAKHARPWHQRVEQPTPTLNWYTDYAG